MSRFRLEDSAVSVLDIVKRAKAIGESEASKALAANVKKFNREFSDKALHVLFVDFPKKIGELEHADKVWCCCCCD